MGMMYGNGSFKGGIDAAVLAYIGDSTLTTSADNLGDAINEHEQDITEIKSNLTDLIYYKELSHSYSISGNGSTFWNPHSDTGFDVTGYTPIGVIGFTAGGTNAVPLSLYVEDNQYSMGLKNTSSGTVTGNCKYIVMYIKS